MDIIDRVHPVKELQQIIVGNIHILIMSKDSQGPNRTAELSLSADTELVKVKVDPLI
jgi:hypothetical protein